MPGPLRVLALVAASLVVSGCGLYTTSRNGQVGDTLSAGALRATVIKVKRRVRPPRHDVTGLATPSAGSRFFGVEVDVCNEAGLAIKPYDFQLEQDGGDKVHPHLPQTVYSDDFGGVRTGCERGWMLFEIPTGSRPTKLSFKYDDTGNARPSGKEKHARFSWDLG
jgi:hypothetical protein